MGEAKAAPSRSVEPWASTVGVVAGGRSPDVPADDASDELKSGEPADDDQGWPGPIDEPPPLFAS